MTLKLLTIQKPLSLLLLLSGVLCTIFTSCQKELSILDIQRNFNKSEAPRPDEFVQLVEKYYLSRSVPDSYHSEIDSLVKKYIRSQNQNVPESLEFYSRRGYYQIDFDLFEIVRQICAAKIRKDTALELAYKNLSSSLADTLADKSQNFFWQNWLPTLNNYSKTEALVYLKASCADSICRAEYREIDGFDNAENYTSLSLSYSRDVFAPRLYLDIMQRILVFLAEKYEAHDLAIATADFILPESEKNDYTIRSVAIRCKKAIALCDKGKIDHSINELRSVLDVISQNSLMPNLNSYRIEALLMLVFAEFQAGDYDEASQLCQNLASEKLQKDYKTKLLIYKGIIATKQGRYDDAEIYLNSALKNANDLGNNYLAINTLVNLGDLFIELSDFDMALSFTNSAMNKLQNCGNSDMASQIDILTNFVEIYALKSDKKKFKLNLSRLVEQIEYVNSPYRKGICYCNIGNSFFKTQNLKKAEKSYKKALDLFYENDLQRKYLETLIEWGNCLLEIEHPEGFENALQTMKNYSLKHDDPHSLIEYYALAAEWRFRQQKFDQAIDHSEKVWDVVLAVQKNIKSSTNLELFNQRVYHHLKKAVQYEIESGHPEAAFVKLENAKAWSMKRLSKHEALVYMNAQPHEIVERIQQLVPKNSVVISYILLNEKSYIFYLANENFDLFPLADTGNNIKQLTLSYTSLVSNSGDILRKGDADQIKENFTQCEKTLAALSEILLPAKIRTRLEKCEKIYFVPDEILWQFPYCSLVKEHNNVLTYLAESQASVCIPSAAFAAHQQTFTPNEDFSQEEIVYCVDHHYRESKQIESFISQNFVNATYLSMDSLSAPRKTLLNQVGQGRVFIFFGHCYSDMIYADSSFIRASIYNKADSLYHRMNLSLHDLQNIIWDKTDLVILMGCGTARGKLVKGSGLGGIQHWVQKLGVPNVLATLWEIDSYTAASQLEYILDALCAGKSLEKSLQESQQKLINTYRLVSPGYAHPFLWGSYRVSQTHTL